MRWPFLLVGMTGFEPATPCTQNRCATKLRHIPEVYCHRNRSSGQPEQVYPIEWMRYAEKRKSFDSEFRSAPAGVAQW